MAKTLTLTNEKLAAIIAAAIETALTDDGQGQETRKTTAHAPRQTAKANRMVSKWQTIEGLEVVTLQRHKYNHELMDSSRVKRMVSNEVKDCRKQGVEPTKILADGTWYFVKLPKDVTRDAAQAMHAIEGWSYSKKEHAFYRDFK
jgi:hypothetical protein